MFATYGYTITCDLKRKNYLGIFSFQSMPNLNFAKVQL